jgi:hypothetical protein
MPPLCCDCPHCRSGFQIDDEAIVDAVRILHQAGMEAMVNCPQCGRTAVVPPDELPSPD